MMSLNFRVLIYRRSLCELLWNSFALCLSYCDSFSKISTADWNRKGCRVDLIGVKAYFRGGIRICVIWLFCKKKNFLRGYMRWNFLNVSHFTVVGFLEVIDKNKRSKASPVSYNICSGNV